MQLTIYGILGQEVVTLADESYPTGEHTAEWHGVNDFGEKVGSGIYFYRLNVIGEDGQVQFAGLRRLLLLK